MKQNPIFHLLRFVILVCRGEIRLTAKEQEQDLDCREEKYLQFLDVTNQYRSQSCNHPVVLRIRFRVKRMSLFQRRILPWLSIPFCAGSSGFIAKRFLVNEEKNAFQGIYLWESIAVIEQYLNSYAMGFMRNNAMSGSVHYEVE